jgi:hypothetical protein
MDCVTQVIWVAVCCCRVVLMPFAAVYMLLAVLCAAGCAPMLLVCCPVRCCVLCAVCCVLCAVCCLCAALCPAVCLRVCCPVLPCAAVCCVCALVLLYAACVLSSKNNQAEHTTHHPHVKLLGNQIRQVILLCDL